MPTSVVTPVWVDALAWVGLALGVASTGVVAADIWLAGHRQRMPIMNAVWPITALYFGPAAVWGYLRLGRPRSHDGHPQPARSAHDNPIGGAEDGGRTPAWHSGALSASHCGAGCVMGDIVGGWVIFATGWTVAGDRLYAEYAAEFTLAWLAGIAFQYFAIKPGRPDLTVHGALAEAIKADTLSILAFQVGMFAWMALTTLVIFGGPVPINGPVFWFMMQIGLILGFATTYPVNRWLVRAGIKHTM